MPSYVLKNGWENWVSLIFCTWIYVELRWEKHSSGIDPSSNWTDKRRPDVSSFCWNGTNIHWKAANVLKANEMVYVFFIWLFLIYKDILAAFSLFCGGICRTAACIQLRAKTGYRCWQNDYAKTSFCLSFCRSAVRRTAPNLRDKLYKFINRNLSPDDSKEF